VQFAVPLLNECEAYWLTLRGAREWRVFGNMALRRIIGDTTEEVSETRRKLHNDEFVICTLHQILLCSSNRGEGDGKDI
jgi:hypothetical protein